MTLKIRSLDFGSLFTYTPRPNSNDPTKQETMKKARNLTLCLKADSMVKVSGFIDQIPMSRYVAHVLKKTLSSLPYSDFFDDKTVLIPVPSSSQVPKDGLWVPERMTKAIRQEGIGYSVVPCLKRINSVRKSAYIEPGERPSPSVHYESLSADGGVIADFEKAVLIDDVVTRGSTLIGAANRLHEAFPKIEIKGFAAIRTISNALVFHEWFVPVKGAITLNQFDEPTRVP